MSGLGVAWLARGQVHLRTAEGTSRTLESRFGETVAGRALQLEQRHAWKTQGRGAQFMSGGLLWGTKSEPGAGVPYVITSLSRGRAEGELLYSLETREIAGVFAVREGGADEQRLFHGNDRRVRHLSADPTRGLIACSLSKPSGVACLAVMSADALDLTEVTEGDVLDAAPAWVPGPGRRLVYHSSGIARNKEGFVTGIGPAAVRQVDLDRGEVETLAEDPRHDLLAPRRGASGTLYFVRRPWRGADRTTFGAAMKDFLLFPGRLLFAFFQWLNFFSVRYSGKPLTTAGGPRKEGADIRQMMIWGNLIDAEQAARESADRGEDAPDLVPQSWQLVRQTGSGEQTVLARGVLAFDLAEDGSLVYTNGNAIWRMGDDGKKERLCVDRQIEQVVAVG